MTDPVSQADAGPRVFLIAAEPSGDRLGAALMKGLSELAPGTRFDGIGGPEMGALGLESRVPMSELAVMGLWEVLPRYRALKRRISQTAQAITEIRPDVLITIDAPDFGLRVARLARGVRPDLATVHYVAPSVWAWRPGRASRMAEVIDHVLALLPFEPPLMRAAGMSCDFTGHPVVAEPRATPEEAAAFRAEVGPGPLMLVLPGSRMGEVTRLGPRFARAVELLREKNPRLSAVVPTVPHVADAVRAMFPQARVVTDAQEKRAAFAAADLALAASGTVSLELAANDVPMVIGYDMAPLTRWIMGRLIRTDTVTLVNLVSETRAVPEFLGRACQPETLAAAVQRLLSDPAAVVEQRAAMALTMQRLGQCGPLPGVRAAASVLAYLDRRATIQPPPNTRLPSSA
ncbi:lipid-A-disaccharide synthase [Paracoccus suum]|uniref:Lipid-A-disaccharide synthase n=1 Tax=Paracoccus suum TaxID=2259340 RepID=A0A344PL52_9RHOB|nr:lipid-A-disaccharide synthase [Paracoccus suum]AXC50107.1 lipid-A-disaccharide synthase [Paracoccus suum]